MIIYKTLENTSTAELHKTFMKAFFDYQVKINFTLSKFENMLLKNGYISNASIGAFDNDKLVGFSLTAIRRYQGVLTAYDVSTGVIKEHKNRGIASNMFSELKDNLRNIGVSKYQLEVIQGNTAAEKTYRKQGFEISRELNCFKLDEKDLELDFVIEHKDKFNDYEWKQVIKFWDYSPSWQNSIDSIKNSKDNNIYGIIQQDNKIVAYGIMDKATGDIQQIAVNKEFRNKGYGKAIVLDLIKWAVSKTVTILNIDSRDYILEGFLKHIGFTDYVKQYEMILNL